jgi:hypothetical protein
MPTALSAVITDMVTGLATVTGLSTAQVTDNKWQTIEYPVAVFVFPAGRGTQRVVAMGPSFERVHNVLVELHVKNTQGEAALYNDTQTYLDRVLDWFTTYEATTSAMTCHAETGIYYDVLEQRADNGGVIRRVVTFTVPVQVQ